MGNLNVLNMVCDVTHKCYLFHQIYVMIRPVLHAGMPLGLLKIVGKYPGTGGLGGEPPAGSRGSALVGVKGGEAPLMLELFLNQNCPESHQLTRMVVTHTIHARGKKKKKSEGLKKSEFRQKSEKRHPCTCMLMLNVKIVALVHVKKNTHYSAVYTCIKKPESFSHSGFLLKVARQLPLNTPKNPNRKTHLRSVIF